MQDKSLNIRIAAAELHSALNELIYVSTHPFETLRFEENKRQFQLAMEMVVAAMDGNDPLKIKYRK